MTETLVRQARELFADLGAFAAALESRVLVPAGRAIVDGAIAQTDLTAEEKQVIEHGRTAIARLASGATAAELTSEQVDGLQLVFYLTVRPALRVLGRGVAGPFPREWASLEHADGVIGTSIRGTVRIDLGGRHRGTGFAIGRGAILTNQHVVREVATKTQQGWAARPDVTVDFLAEGGDTRARFSVTAVDDVHPTLDVAVLRIDVAALPREPDAFELPAPLLFAPTDRSVGTQVVAVGCPGKPKPFDGYASEVIWRLFDDNFGVKRVSPGVLKHVDRSSQVVVHDCSTLGGSSGSPLVDLHDGLVVGVHFWGEAGFENRAVLPSRSDPFFNRHVRFG